MKFLTSIDIIKSAITLIILLVFTMNGYLMYHYVLLSTSTPLDNFRGSFVSPISLASENVIRASGFYDRNVTCKLTDFNIHLTNTKTNDEIVIGPKQLAKAPPVNLRPGKDIPISFEVYIPRSVYPGIWSSIFHGIYMCKSGIFVNEKTVHITTSNITFTE